MISHKDDQYKRYTLLLGDYHREYTGVLDEVAYTYDETLPKEVRADSYVRCAVIWDQYELIDTVMEVQGVDRERAESAVERMQAQIFRTPDADFTDVPNIWRLEGTTYALSRAFDVLAQALDTTVGGDDDAFDYWPNTMDMLHEFAADLDKLIHTDQYGKRVEDLATTVLERSSTDEENRELLRSEWNYPERWERVQR